MNQIKTRREGDKLMFHLITILVEWASDQVDLIEMLLIRLLPQNELSVFLFSVN